MNANRQLRFTVWLGLAVMLTISFRPAASAQTEVSATSLPAACQVTTDAGVVAGTASGQTCIYKGIPFAASTAGDMRWRSPASATPWSGVRSATAFGNVCPQLSGTNVIGDEDCLNLNIWAPQSDGPLAVMVYMHGGGNRANSNRSAAGISSDGQYIAEHGPAIVVTINYRLGALGWLAHPALDAASPSGTSGNYGIMDQVAALQWMQRNIAAFGGDPARVLLFGESSGAQDSWVLLASPFGRGLFTNMLTESAGPANFYQSSLADYEAEIGIPAVTAIGCGTALDVVACLRATPAGVLIRKAPGTGTLKHGGSTYQPAVDGYILPDTVFEVVREGRHNHVPVVLGSNTAEASHPAFTGLMAVATEDAYVAAISDLFSDYGQSVIDQVLALYPTASYASPRAAYVDAATDYRWTCPNRRMANALSKSQNEPVFRYLFSHPVPTGPAVSLGAFHTEELMWVFHTFASQVSGAFVPSADELALSDRMIGYWTRFAATQDPNSETAVHWPVYGKNADNSGGDNVFFDSGAQGDLRKDTYLQLDTTIIEGAGYHANVCEDFWDKLVGYTNNGHGPR
jgi:para-nitrobenzyl esterase